MRGMASGRGKPRRSSTGRQETCAGEEEGETNRRRGRRIAGGGGRSGEWEESWRSD